MITDQSAGYKESKVSFRLTDNERLMLKITSDIRREKQSALIRRLVREEASRAAAELDGEELSLWLDLLQQVDYEEEKRRAFRALKIGESESRTRQLTAPKTQDAAYHRQYRANRRVRKYMQTLKELKKKYGA